MAQAPPLSAPVAAPASIDLPLDLPWPQDDTEESVMGADWHQEAILQAYGPLKAYAGERDETSPWYVSAEVTVQIPLSWRVWSPKPDLFVVPGISPVARSSYDARVEGPVPPFVLEVVSESTWRNDIGFKRLWYGFAGVREYLVFDPISAYLPASMVGWHATEEGWVDWPPTYRDDGSLVWESAVLSLTVRPEGPLVRFDHPQTGPLPLPSELKARVVEQEKALAEERRLRGELEAELRRLRGEG